MAAGEVDEVGRDEVAYSSREGREERRCGFSPEVVCAKDEVADMTNVQAQLLVLGDPCHVGVQLRIFEEVGIVNRKFM